MIGLDFPLVAGAAIVAPLGVAAALRWHHRRRLARLASLGTDAALARLAPPDVRRAPVARGVRLALALALATIGLAGPRWGEGTQVIRQRGLDVAIAMDASLSMLAQDERPSRIERMRQEVRRYRAASPGDRNALIAFAGKSYILTPLTTDDGAIELFLDNFDPNVVGLAGTALAPTIIQGTGLLQAASGSASRVLVILSDGEAFDDRDASIDAARAARQAGISVITVGFGTEEGATIPDTSGSEPTARRDQDGNVITTRYDPSLLRDVADAAGGEFIPATVGDRGGRVVQALARLDAAQRDVEEGLARPLHLTWFLLPAVLLLLLDAWRADGGSWDRLRRLARLAMPAILLVTMPAHGIAQGAGRLYAERRFLDAAAEWRAAIARGDARLATVYNLGAALLAADSLGTAEQAFERAAASPETRIRQLALYNLGLTRLKRALQSGDADRQRAAEGAIAAYRALLREAPGDREAKWNYELALRVRRDGSGGGQRSDPRSTPERAQAQQEDRQTPMSRQQAEQLLSAAARDERDTQSRRQAENRVQLPPGGKGW